MMRNWRVQKEWESKLLQSVKQKKSKVNVRCLCTVEQDSYKQTIYKLSSQLTIGIQHLQGTKHIFTLSSRKF